MRMIRLFILLPLLTLVPVAAAHADAVVAGDLIKFADLPGNTGGGEFKLTVNNDPANSFISFCLQKTEYMDFTSTFIVGSVNDYTLTDPVANGGNASGQDPISSQTAWLYTQFRNGTLASYAYNNVGNGVFATEELAANSLQHAFWGFENEEALDANNYYVKLANSQNLANFGIGNVGVLNLYKYSATAPNHLGSEAQDQLVIRAVPEPATMTLFGVGALATAFSRKRSTRR